MALLLIKLFYVECMSFQDTFNPLPFTSEWDLMKMVDYIADLDFGPTDCSLPMIWATEEKKEIDVFIVFTDNDTYAGNVRFLIYTPL